jgi:hypothetical protein
VPPAVTGADLRPWGDRSPREIVRRAVIEFLDRYEARPYMGNRALAAVRKLMNWSAWRAKRHGIAVCVIRTATVV